MSSQDVFPGSIPDVGGPAQVITPPAGDSTVPPTINYHVITEDQVIFA